MMAVALVEELIVSDATVIPAPKLAIVDACDRLPAADLLRRASCLVLGYPNAFGVVEDLTHAVEVTHAEDCLVISATAEALALAGHLKLAKLIVLYDDNAITIDGHLERGLAVNFDTMRCSQTADGADWISGQLGRFG